MPKISLNDAALRSLPTPEAGQLDYWDSGLTSFGVRVSQGGSKTFILNISNSRRAIGRYPVISLSEARDEAKRILAEKTLGKLRPQPLAFPRPTRRLQKYCARGDLDCRKVETSSAEKYLITPESVERHIAYIRQTATAAGRVPARPDASERAPELQTIKPPKQAAPEPAQARPGAPDFQERYISHLETENSFLREQNTVLLERVKETNILTGRLQEMLTPLLAPERQPQATTVSHKEASEKSAE
jgi:hypothetical protein